MISIKCWVEFEKSAKQKLVRLTQWKRKKKCLLRWMGRPIGPCLNRTPNDNLSTHIKMELIHIGTRGWKNNKSIDSSVFGVATFKEETYIEFSILCNALKPFLHEVDTHYKCIDTLERIREMETFSRLMMDAYIMDMVDFMHKWYFPLNTN